jgi:hypothetical protein
VLRWVGALVAAGVMSGLVLLLLTGHYIDEGPVIATFTRTHGLHEGDLLVLVGWFVGMAGLVTAVLAPDERRRRRTPS